MSDLTVIEVTVAPAVQAVEVAVASPIAVVEIVERGLQGPAGPEGPVGDGFEFMQAQPQPQWLINHNLGYRPGVFIFSLGGVEIEATVIHASANQVLIHFNTATAGMARLV